MAKREINKGEAKLLLEFVLHIAGTAIDGEPDTGGNYNFDCQEHLGKSFENFVLLARRVANKVKVERVRQELAAIPNPEFRKAWKKCVEGPDDHSLWLLMKIAESR